MPVDTLSWGGVLVAEMVLPQGNAQGQPLDQALDELADAVRDRQKNRPFGAVAIDH